MGWFSRQMERSKQYAEEHKLDITFEGWRLSGDQLFCTKLKHPGQWDVTSVHAEVINGPTQNTINIPAAALGGLIFGPVGAIIGGSAKIDRSKCYLLITLPDGQATSDDFPVAKYGDALKFATRINHAATVFVSRGGSAD